MNKMTTATALIGLMASCASCQSPAYAQTVGDACIEDTAHITTIRSNIQSQGAIECVPDSNGHYFWQAMGSGIARYDSTASCSTAGSLRWNGSAIQYCDGSNWQNIGGTTLVVGGCQTYWSSCPAGYSATSYFSPGTYNCCDRCGNPSWKYTVCSQ